MPKYKVTDPDSGKTLMLTGDSPPTDAELEEIFQRYRNKPTEEIKPATWKQKYGPYIRPAIEYGVTGLGAALTTPAALASGPAAPITEAAGISTAYLAGKTLADYILGPPESAAEAFKGVASDIPEAAIVGMTGPIVGKAAQTVGGRLYRFGMPKVKRTPEVEKAIDLSRETKVPLTIADISKKKSHAIIESQLRRGYASTDIAEKYLDKRYAALQDFSENVQRKAFGGPADPLVAGQVAQKQATARYRAFQARAKTLYEKTPIPPNTNIETQTLSQTAAEEADVLGKIQNSTIKRILSTVGEGERTVVSPVLGPTGQPIKPAYQWQELVSDQSTLRTLARKTSDYNLKRIYRNLVNAINDDIAIFSEKAADPAIKNALDDAVGYYRSGDIKLPGVKVWRERQIKNMMYSDSPEKIVKEFFKAYPNRSNIERLKRVVGPKGFHILKQAWLDELLSLGEGQSFNPARFATQYDKYRAGRNLNVMLTRPERIGLDRLYDISKRINQAEKLAGNPSGTGQININDLARWVRHPIRQTILHFGTKRFAERYFNDPYFRILIFDLLEKPPNIAGQIGVQAGIAGAVGAQEVINQR